MAMKAQKKELEINKTLDCYVIAIGEQAQGKAVELLYQLRQAGIRADKDYLDKKNKSAAEDC